MPNGDEYTYDSRTIWRDERIASLRKEVNELEAKVANLIIDRDLWKAAVDAVKLRLGGTKK